MSFQKNILFSFLATTDMCSLLYSHWQVFFCKVNLRSPYVHWGYSTWPCNYFSETGGVVHAVVMGGVHGIKDSG
jgi:hypothetical protein